MMLSGKAIGYIVVYSTYMFNIELVFRHRHYPSNASGVFLLVVEYKFYRNVISIDIDRAPKKVIAEFFLMP